MEHNRPGGGGTRDTCLAGLGEYVLGGIVSSRTESRGFRSHQRWSSRCTRDRALSTAVVEAIVEAAFPVATGSLRSDIDLTLHGNALAAACQNNLLVSFRRHTTALVPTRSSSEPSYLSNVI